MITYYALMKLILSIFCTGVLLLFEYPVRSQDRVSDIKLITFSINAFNAPDGTKEVELWFETKDSILCEAGTNNWLVIHGIDLVVATEVVRDYYSKSRGIRFILDDESYPLVLEHGIDRVQIGNDYGKQVYYFTDDQRKKISEALKEKSTPTHFMVDGSHGVSLSSGY